jgi:hypothetical protein
MHCACVIKFNYPNKMPAALGTLALWLNQLKERKGERQPNAEENYNVICHIQALPEHSKVTKISAKFIDQCCWLLHTWCSLFHLRCILAIFGDDF